MSDTKIHDLFAQGFQGIADRVGETGLRIGYLGRADGTTTVVNSAFAFNREMFYYEIHAGQVMPYASAPVAAGGGIFYENSTGNKDLPVVLGYPAGSTTLTILRPAGSAAYNATAGLTPLEVKINGISGGGAAVTAVTASAPLASSGGTTPNISVTGIVPLANGGTGANLSATGGANQVVKQTGAGAAFTVAAITSADLTSALTTPPAIGGTTPAAITASTLTVTAAGSATAYIAGGTGNFRSLIYNTGASNRWATTANSTTETGSNAGTDFAVYRYDDTGASLGTPLVITRATGVITTEAKDAGTGTALDGLIVGRATSGTAAAGLGAGVLLKAYSDSGVMREQARIRGSWIDAANGTRKARVIYSAWDTAERDCLALEASGTAPMLGFLGAAPVVQQTMGVATAGATYTATEQGMINTLWSVLRTFGLGT